MVKLDGLYLILVHQPTLLAYVNFGVKDKCRIWTLYWILMEGNERNIFIYFSAEGAQRKPA